ncbi:putative membrane protein YfcA [Paenibacillus phyllosphaerae]|uniref:Putative membrane protein YfcA n=1 Tax=Paenibacillus phyllosphaerae TaxID=274593 RepID=A0A7W5AUS0_9BACL|nr:hypothetical protein [Paenibacillus phyllosphaerae]MBB3109158.1 putative membrane protein YfcA [Paenibacillus phyllosphaerae]
MPRKMSPLFVVILTLAGLGLVYQLYFFPERLLIPVIVLGAIFVAYFLQIRGRRAKPRPKQEARRDTMSSKPKTRKTVPFRVIEGGKDDDNLPKYH